jgi:hypothetical protein
MENAMTDNSPIEIKLVETHAYQRLACTVCGGWTEKHSVKAETDNILVCETCLEAGNIDERLAENARKLEAYAAAVRSLIGRLRVPSFEQWQAEIDRSNIRDQAQEVLREHESQGDTVETRDDVAGLLIDPRFTPFIDDVFADWRAYREWKAKTPRGMAAADTRIPF